MEYLWLRDQDLNPNKVSQSHSCYHYTIPQYLYVVYRYLTLKSNLYLHKKRRSIVVFVNRIFRSKVGYLYFTLLSSTYAPSLFTIAKTMMQWLQKRMVPKAGLEPARPVGHYPLKIACLPVPPLRLLTIICCRSRPTKSIIAGSSRVVNTFLRVKGTVLLTHFSKMSQKNRPLDSIRLPLSFAFDDILYSHFIFLFA